MSHGTSPRNDVLGVHPTQNPLLCDRGLVQQSSAAQTISTIKKNYSTNRVRPDFFCFASMLWPESIEEPDSLCLVGLGSQIRKLFYLSPAAKFSH